MATERTEMTIEEIRRTLTARMRGRHAEIAQATLTRIRSIVDPASRPDSEYTNGLPAVVSAALDYGIEALERSDDSPAPIPTVLLSQARLAARHGVSLETVLRRYLAGYTLLGDFLIEESEKGGLLTGPSLRGLLRAQAGVLDRLIVAVGEEYGRETEDRAVSAQERLLSRVKKLLAGEMLDPSSLAYDMAGRHLGLVAVGPAAPALIRDIARALNCHLLIARPSQGTTWAWLGSERELDARRIRALVRAESLDRLSLAAGEVGEGLDGWRLTHRQAMAASHIALRGEGGGVVQYGDVALMTALVADDLLEASMRELYLRPLAEGSGGDGTLRETVKAYVAAAQNVSSAAAALGVNRHTVAGRLRIIEERIGRPLSTCLAEVDAVIRLDDLGNSRTQSPGPAGS